MNDYYVYILTNVNNTTLYVGITNNLVRRIYEHRNKGIDGFTKRYSLNKLVYYENSTDVAEAINREKILKKWSRAKKLALISKFNPQWLDLSDNFS